MTRRVVAAGFALALMLAAAGPAFAQQRPLVTEDAEPIGAGRVLIEGGLDLENGVTYTVSGLKGNLISVPTIGVSIGISSIAELQIDGGLYNSLNITSRDPNAPLANLLTVTGNSTHDVSDAVVGMKIRMMSEAEGRPALAVRFATKLPNASNESGLGLDTTDFAMTLLASKNIQSVRLVGNFGFAILGDPTDGNRQNDVILYGFSFARAVTQAVELVGEVNGRESTRSNGPLPGTESRGILKLGGRFTHGSLRLDAGVFFGMTTIDPTIGLTAGFTYVFNAFKVP
jgi:Putative MetA-pathway of phenol degradation